MFRWVKPRGSTLYEGLGAVLLLPVKWPRLTGAIGTSLRRRHIVCGSQCHMKPIPDEMFILYIKRTCGETYQIKCLHIMRIGGETYQIKCLYITRIGGETHQIKFLYIKQTCGETYQIKCLCIK